MAVVLSARVSQVVPIASRMFPMNCCTRVFEFYINGSYNLHIVVCEGALKICPQDLNTAILEKTPAIISWNGMDKAGLRKGILMCRAKRLDERYASVKDIIREREGLQVLSWLLMQGYGRQDASRSRTSRERKFFFPYLGIFSSCC